MIVLGGNSPAFRSIVISLTIVLGALIGAVLLYEMVVFFYQRVVTKNRTEDLENGGGKENSVAYFLTCALPSLPVNRAPAWCSGGHGSTHTCQVDQFTFHTLLIYFEIQWVFVGNIVKFLQKKHG